MKYLIAIILLIAFFVLGQVMENEFPLVLNLAIIIIVFLISILWEYGTINKKIEADIKFRSLKKTTSFYSLALPVYLTTLFFLYENYKNLIFVILLLWAISFAELLMFFVYKNKKPFTIFIKGNELILNKRWTQKRNLTEVNQIQYDRISKELIFDFKSKPEISIKTKEYKPNDIQRLLEIMIDKSEYDIFIPKNYEPIKNN